MQPFNDRTVTWTWEDMLTLHSLCVSVCVCLCVCVYGIDQAVLKMPENPSQKNNNQLCKQGYEFFCESHKSLLVGTYVGVGYFLGAILSNIWGPHWRLIRCQVYVKNVLQPPCSSVPIPSILTTFWLPVFCYHLQ